MSAMRRTARSGGGAGRERVFPLAMRWVLGGLLLFILYANIVGIPDFITRPLLRSIGSERMVVDASRIRLRGVRALVLSDLRIYRRARLGPAGLSVDGLVVRLGPGEVHGNWVGVSSVDAWNVVVHTQQLRGESRGGGFRPFHFRRPLSTMLRAHDLTIDGVALGELSARVSCQDDRLSFREVKARGQTLGAGELSGEFVVDTGSGQIEAEVGSTISPVRLMPLFDSLGIAAVNRYVSCFAFGEESPHCRLKLTHVLGETNTVAAVRVLSRNASYRGISTERLDGLIRVERTPDGGSVTLSELLLERPEGVSRGYVRYPFGSRLPEFKVSGSADPIALLGMAGMATDRFAQFVTLGDGVHVEVSGVVDLDRAGRTQVTGRVSAARAICLERLPLSQATADLSVTGDQVLVTNMLATCSGGRVEGWVRVGVAQGEGVTNRTDLGFVLTGADFGALCRELGAEREGLEGSCSVKGWYRVDRSGEKRSQRGNVELRVRDGRVFALPLFGGFSKVMAAVLPGLDFVMRQSAAKLDVEIEDQRLHARRVVVEGDVLSLSGDGHYDIGGELDLDIQVKLMKEHTLVAKVLRVVTYPVSWLFEFRVTGPLGEPRWYPVNFSSDLLRKLGLGGEDKDDK